MKNRLKLLGSTDRDIAIALVNYIEQYVIPKSVKLIFYFNLFALSWKENGKKNEAVKMKSKLNWLCEIEMIVFFYFIVGFFLLICFSFLRKRLSPIVFSVNSKWFYINIFHRFLFRMMEAPTFNV